MIMWRSMPGMIKSLLTIAILYSSQLSGNIIYVYLSPELPEYVYVALEQARLFNPKTNIFLIANLQAINQGQVILRHHNILSVAAEHLHPSKEHEQFNATSTLDTHSYGGLWRKSTERFFYMQELIALYNLKTVIHVEADVMLYVDVLELQEGFYHYAGIGAVFDCDYRCIPSVIYISNEKAINHLATFIAQNASRGLYDMHILAEYRNTYTAEYIDNLPLLMPEYLENNSLVNSLGQGTTRARSYVNNTESFKSIFDAAAIGQYLGGVSPVHGTPKPGFINETCLFNPSLATYEWRKDTQGRNVPFVHYNRAAYRINNLHIHSKQLHLFKS